uniref:NR LBD domain-containing protein n=1 Tax=Acrobeloides nanus TaxID=290746 RepID=A0A914E1E9_9BILA
MTLEEEPKNVPKTKKNSTCIKTAIPSISENKTSEVSFTSYDQRSNLQFKIDLAPLEEAISKILSQPYANSITPGIRLTFMQRLNYGFALFYEDIKPRDPIEISYEFDLLALHKHQWKFLVELAKMLMFCEQFASLNYKDKYLLFKNSWRLIYELERLYSTIEYFGSTIDDWRIMFDDTTAIDFRKVKRSKEMSQETFDKSQSLWIPFQQKQQNLLINPMKTLKLTEYELVYLIAQMLWTLQDDEDYSEQTRLVAEDVSEQITNELHNYYVYQIGLTNYAHRLVKLTKLIESSKPYANSISSGIQLTFMQRLNHGFTLFYEGIKPRDPIKISYEYGLLALRRHQEKFLVELAKMLMFCEQFASLNYKDKYLLFKHSWRFIYQLERLYSTIEYFGTAIDDGRIMFDDKTAIDFSNLKRSKDMSQETFDKSKSLWIPFQQKQQNLLINPMKALKLTEYELVYLIAQMLWTLQGYFHSSPIAKITLFL